MIEHLADTLKVPFEPLNPYYNITSNNKALTPAYLKQIAPFVSVVFGLGLRQLGEK